MPHLQFELDFKPAANEKQAFAAEVVRLFSTIMDTGTDHIAITLRCYEPEDMVFGRAQKPGAGKVFLNADIRMGRTPAQKRQLSLDIMADLESRWRVPREQVYIIYSEHDGPDFQLSERVLPSWSEGEDPLED